MMDINPEQRAIAQHIHGALLVLAPAGTGKTGILTQRILRAIEAGIEAREILCLTFTNRAAQEMRQRIAQIDGSLARQLTIKTFHGLCVAMLRQDGAALGLAANFTIYDDYDSFELIKEIFNLQGDRQAWDMTQQIMNCKSQHHLGSGASLPEIFALLGDEHAIHALRYQRALQVRQAVDFADLVYYGQQLFTDRDIAERWGDRFHFIQVDEVQDTHLSEYEIVAHLARNHGNLMLIGDLDQTIFSWRGSEPEQVLQKFEQEFQPTRYSLVWNYRSTQSLLQAADTFAHSFSDRHTQIEPAPTCPLGEPICAHSAPTPQAEAEWISEQIKALAQTQANFSYQRVAVLARTNWRIKQLSSYLEQLGIPCITSDQLEFFQQPAIKDALALLRILLNPFDSNALRRVLPQLLPNIEPKILQTIEQQGRICGLWLTDLVNLTALKDGDPLGALIEDWEQGTVIVFDVETTGFSVVDDEVIELAASRFDQGQFTLPFQRYVQNNKPVAETEQVHGYSDEFLRINGRPPKEVFRDFARFAQRGLWIGHNLGFDVKMVAAHARRVGLELEINRWGDTLNLAHRFVRNVENYKLGTLATHFQLESTPTHRADADVRTTAELFGLLIQRAKSGCQERRHLIQTYQPHFYGFAQQLSNWQQASDVLRPQELLIQILEESGLYAHYENKGDGTESLQQLIHLFGDRDQPHLHPHTALREMMEYTSLMKNIDHLAAIEARVPIITVHQSKGLEFDTVFLAGLVDGEFPNGRSHQEGLLEEEKRLFYVGLTRAQKQLFLSTHEQDDRGSLRSRSGFMDVLIEAGLLAV
ncbi:UvrD-helicase domain-containing protein [Candidatus Synechococcus calcipolaris G9]|uniref:DNA 3'-5' helicase n=1 Tax=Candidatus Synechococcus calcipolaris G9 TaxID=1497997 RepID=A0ABT6F302_9SYNE|nr:3'-5' exonuclease [Candidatus Synechococcus calcipolaris]MDG2992180.1 UvrD-helicase domain-containing protein [Candidatus Synechococcus calcipolaris G9]